jgi:hypothetical protein
MRVTSRHLTCRPCRRIRALWIAGTALAFFFIALAVLAAVVPSTIWAPMPHVLVADLTAVAGMFIGHYLYERFNRHARHPGARTSR